MKRYQIQNRRKVAASIKEGSFIGPYADDLLCVYCAKKPLLGEYMSKYCGIECMDNHGLLRFKIVSANGHKRDPWKGSRYAVIHLAEGVNYIDPSVLSSLNSICKTWFKSSTNETHLEMIFLIRLWQIANKEVQCKL